MEVRRSKRRRRTVSAYRDGDAIVVMLPARFTKAQEREWVAAMVERVEAAEARSRLSDDDLMTRAAKLSGTYLGGAAKPVSVRWVTNQSRRWGSCTPGDRTIRLSSRLEGLPAWVVDYVLLHELAHLIEPGHTPAFWALVEKLPHCERAKGFLEGVAAADAQRDARSAGAEVD